MDRGGRNIAFTASNLDAGRVRINRVLGDSCAFLVRDVTIGGVAACIFHFDLSMWVREVEVHLFPFRHRSLLSRARLLVPSGAEEAADKSDEYDCHNYTRNRPDWKTFAVITRLGDG